MLEQYRDDFVSFILADVRLNRYDNKFISNINKKYISQNRPLTIKQSEVFDVIVKKYTKQLKTLQVNYNDILALKWKNGFCSEAELAKYSYFRCIDNEMQLYFKFSKDDINEVRTLIYDDKCLFLNKNNSNKYNSEFIVSDNEKYNFYWDKLAKMWRGEFNVHLFRTLYDFAKKHNIKLDKSVIDIMHGTINHFGSKYLWETQLHLVNNRLYVNCIAETMLNTLNNFDLEDTTDINIENICTTLSIKPLSLYTTARSLLMTLIPNQSNMFDTKSKHSQEELYNYLKATGKRTIFYLPTVRSKLWNNFMNNSDNDFINKRQMRNWDINCVINQYSNNNIEREHISYELFNTVITTLGIDELMLSFPELGKFAMNNKFIRIR